MSGFGTVVTGTLLDGQLQVGQEVEILPQRPKTRIRGLQTHKQKVEPGRSRRRGQRSTLTGLSTDQIKRGDVFTTPGWLEPPQLIDVSLACCRTRPGRSVTIRRLRFLPAPPR